MDKEFLFLHNYFLDTFGTEGIFYAFYVINLILAAIAYKLGFARKLPIGKSVIVYILLAIGTFLLALFSIFGLPITESLIVICLVLGIYRFRLHQDRKNRKNI